MKRKVPYPFTHLPHSYVPGRLTQKDFAWQSFVSSFAHSSMSTHTSNRVSFPSARCISKPGLQPVQLLCQYIAVHPSPSAHTTGAGIDIGYYRLQTSVWMHAHVRVEGEPPRIEVGAVFSVFASSACAVIRAECALVDVDTDKLRLLHNHSSGSS